MTWGYIWKLIDCGAVGYYIQPSESGGEPPGRWWGLGTKAETASPYHLVATAARSATRPPGLQVPPDALRRLTEVAAARG